MFFLNQFENKSKKKKNVRNLFNAIRFPSLFTSNLLDSTETFNAKQRIKVISNQTAQSITLIEFIMKSQILSIQEGGR